MSETNSGDLVAVLKSFVDSVGGKSTQVGIVIAVAIIVVFLVVNATTNYMTKSVIAQQEKLEGEFKELNETIEKMEPLSSSHDKFNNVDIFLEDKQTPLTDREEHGNARNNAGKPHKSKKAKKENKNLQQMIVDIKSVERGSSESSEDDLADDDRPDDDLDDFDLDDFDRSDDDLGDDDLGDFIQGKYQLDKKILHDRKFDKLLEIFPNSESSEQMISSSVESDEVFSGLLQDCEDSKKSSKKYAEGDSEAETSANSDGEAESVDSIDIPDMLKTPEQEDDSTVEGLKPDDEIGGFSDHEAHQPTMLKSSGEARDKIKNILGAKGSFDTEHLDKVSAAA